MKQILNNLLINLTILFGMLKDISKAWWLALALASSVESDPVWIAIDWFIIGIEFCQSWK